MLIDTHCHLTMAGLAEQVDDVLAKARAAGVERVIQVAIDLADARTALALMRERPSVFLVMGIHPHEAAACSREDVDAIATLVRGHGAAQGLDERIVAIGEIGLDFHYDFAPRPRQEEIFRAQLDLAIRLQRPVVIHARSSEDRVCDILRDYPQLAGNVVFHCFSGDAAIARRVFDLGCSVSFTGSVTFKNADVIRDAARSAPSDRIMVETDAPFLSPEPVRKIRPNEPALLVHTARFLAELRNVDLDTLAAQTTANAERFFRLTEG